jgi:chromate reductase, NAD(P)H dehydrogenase (quinone)
MSTRRVLMISGSLRDGSTNTAMLETARACAPEGVEAVLYEGLGGLPHFNPDDDVEPLDPSVTELRAAIDAVDAVLFSTPEYAGALPGSFKNLLDWTIGGSEIYEKAVGWVNASALGRATDAYESLGIVLRYAGTRIVDAACVQIPLERRAIGPDGLVADPAVCAELSRVLTALTDTA